MKIEYPAKINLFFAQAYGGDAYGAEVYGDCQQVGDECVPITTSNPGDTTPPGDTDTPTTTTTTTGAPNTGFLGLSSDAAIASVTGALLLAVALVGAVYVIVQRRARKQKTQE